MTSPLFYSPQLQLTALRRYAQGLFTPDAIDVIRFEDHDGGIQERRMAIPFLRGMDRVIVERALLGLSSQPRRMQVDFQERITAQPGVVLLLPRMSRLYRVGLDYEAPVIEGETVRVVVRNAEPESGGFSFSPPVFACCPVFPRPGPLFPRPLSGMSLLATGQGSVLRFSQPPLGRAWLIQLAVGSDPVDLEALQVTPKLRFVRVEALAQDLKLSIRLDQEAPQLWGHPGTFLPETGVQEVDFSPLAQRRLSQALAQADAQSTVTLPVELDLESASGGDVRIVSRRLDARYVVDAVGSEGAELGLQGDWTGLRFDAPAALRPLRASADYRIRLLGRELNAASPEPPLAKPTQGLRVRSGITLAARSRFLSPRPGALGQSPLVAVRLYLSAAMPCEAVMELRGDAAGAPGPLLAPLAARQLEAGFLGWKDFPLEQAWIPPEADIALWVSLRSNQGELFWYEAPLERAIQGAKLVSLDRGASWGAPQEALAPGPTDHPLLIQLFHAVPDPQPEPIVRLRGGSGLLAANLLRPAAGRRPSRNGPREFELKDAPLPSPLLNLLGQQPGTGKASTDLNLFSPAVADLSISNLQLEYDPFQASAAGGKA